MSRENRKREHLLSLTKKDFEIQWFHGSGSGGQHRNKHANCCRMIHRDSGARAECTENRSREANQKVAFQRLTKNPRFKMWLNTKSQEIIEGKTLEKIVDEMVSPEHLKVEVKVDGKWVEEGLVDE